MDCIDTLIRDVTIVMFNKETLFSIIENKTVSTYIRLEKLNHF